MAVSLSEESVAIKNISLPFSKPLIIGMSISIFALDNLRTEPRESVEGGVGGEVMSRASDGPSGCPV